MLLDVLSKTDPDTYVLSGACAPEAQEQLFKKLLRVTGFPSDRFITVDIRGTDNEGILARLKGKVEEIVRNEEAKSLVTPS